MKKEKAIDFQEYIEAMYIVLAEKLKEKGWERQDVGYFEYNRNSKENSRGDKTLPESYVVLYPDLLEYTEGSKWVTKIWFKSGDRELTEEAKEKLFEAFKPFKDEDYRGDDFWINPFMEDGYWSNHALG